jgi:P4 family phage/plasmid primase-like protien
MTEGSNVVRYGDAVGAPPGHVAWICVQLGWRVVPARAGLKHPALPEWPTVASSDPDTVGEWWSGAFADRNVCVVTGRGSGIWVLDVDERSGGYETLAALTAEHGELPKTFAVKTPGGGRHLYWEYPDQGYGEVKTGSNVLGPGLDTRGYGGQVMAPGSMVGGGVYLPVILDGVDIAVAPAWLLAMVKRREGEHGGSWEGQGGTGLPDVETLLSTAREVAPGGQEQALFVFLCKLRAAGRGAAAMEAAGWHYASQFVNVAGHAAGDWTREHVAAKVAHVVSAYPAGSATIVGGAQEAWAAGVGASAQPDEPAPAMAAVVAEEGPDESDELTGTGNAHRFVKRFGADARYVAGAGWFLWDGGVWREDRTQLVLHWTEAIGRDVKDQWHRELEYEVSKARARDLAVHYNRTCSARGRLEMLTLAQSVPSLALTPEELDADRWALRVRNGTLDLRTGMLRTSVREDHHTQEADVLYDPQTRCDNFRRFVANVLPDPAMAAYVQRMFGYCLTGDTSAQAFFFLQGKSGAGKSTLCELLRLTLGGYGAVADENLLYKTDGHPTDLMDLLGKRLVIQDELSKTRRLDTARINRMTGSSTIRGRKMRGDFVDIPVQFKLMMNANNLPGMGGSGVDGIWRRMKLVTFDHAIPGAPVADYARVLFDTEGSGFLNWCLEGLAQYREHGLADPATMRAAVDDYRADEDVMGQFAGEYLSDAPGAWVANADLMTVYLAWCKANGHRPLEGSQAGKWLKQAGYVQSKVLRAKRALMDGGTEARNHRGWVGVRLDVERAGGFLAERPWEPVGEPRSA